MRQNSHLTPQPARHVQGAGQGQNLLFVYGTLRHNAASPASAMLDAHAEPVGNARFQGRLYLVDWYPGVVPSARPGDWVHGEVWQLSNPPVILPHLDAYEACGAGFAEPTEYVRELRPVVLDNGRIESAWIYLYNRPAEGLARIASGDFVNRS